MATGADADRLTAVGLSHHTAPVEVRERLAMGADQVHDLLERLRAGGIAEEAMVISTCNRVEVYSVSSRPEALRDIFPGGAERYLYWHKGREAVRHLFRVASSLDSLVVGEPQILGQVKEAARIAQESSSLGRVLHPLTERTFTVAKRVRNETDIGRFRVGIGNAGVDLALQIFGSLEGKRAMLVGVGEMGRQVARALVSAGLEELLVINRTLEHAQELAAAHGGVAIPWERLEDYLPRADILLAATAAEAPVVTTAMVGSALRARRWQAMFLIDLSVPRNIAPAVADLEDAYLFNIDDLSKVMDEGKQMREAAAAAANTLVDAEADRFVESLRSQDVNGEIGRISKHLDQLRLAEIERSKKLVASLDAEQQAALDRLTRALVKKILYDPMVQLRAAARDGDDATLDALKKLWREE